MCVSIPFYSLLVLDVFICDGKCKFKYTSTAELFQIHTRMRMLHSIVYIFILNPNTDLSSLILLRSKFSIKN